MYEIQENCAAARSLAEKLHFTIINNKNNELICIDSDNDIVIIKYKEGYEYSRSNRPSY